MDVFLIIVALVGVYVVLPVLLLLAKDRWFAPRMTKEQLIAEVDRFKARLRNPNLEAVHAHHGASLPKALLDLYANPDEIQRHDFEIIPPNGTGPIYICDFLPADSENVCSAWPGCQRYFAFADDGAGNELLIDPKLADPPVLLHDHYTGDFETIASCISEFLKWERRS